MGCSNDKVWVVVQRSQGKINSVEVFEYEADAKNFYNELRRSFGIESAEPCEGEVCLFETTLHSREEIPTNETPWGIEIPDVNAEFVEGLIEEMQSQGMELAATSKEALTAQFLEKRAEKLQAEANELVRDFVLDELKDFLEKGMGGCACTED